jgi:hypothetical protein
VTLPTALGLAFASDTLSIATMEVIDNAVMLVIPGAMVAGVGTVLSWSSLAISLTLAFFAAVPEQMVAEQGSRACPRPSLSSCSFLTKCLPWGPV